MLTGPLRRRWACRQSWPRGRSLSQCRRGSWWHQRGWRSAGFLWACQLRVAVLLYGRLTRKHEVLESLAPGRIVTDEEDTRRFERSLASGCPQAGGVVSQLSLSLGGWYLPYLPELSVVTTRLCIGATTGMTVSHRLALSACKHDAGGELTKGRASRDWTAPRRQLGRWSPLICLSRPPSLQSLAGGLGARMAGRGQERPSKQLATRYLAGEWWWYHVEPRGQACSRTQAAPHWWLSGPCEEQRSSCSERESLASRERTTGYAREPRTRVDGAWRVVGVVGGERR